MVSLETTAAPSTCGTAKAGSESNFATKPADKGAKGTVHLDSTAAAAALCARASSLDMGSLADGGPPGTTTAHPSMHRGTLRRFVVTTLANDLAPQGAPSVPEESELEAEAEAAESSTQRAHLQALAGSKLKTHCGTTNHCGEETWTAIDLTRHGGISYHLAAHQQASLLCC